MEMYDVPLSKLNITVSVLVERKKMKTCRLKVFPDKTIKFSVPENTPKLWIEQYLTSKKQWISTKIQNFEQTKGYAATDEIRSGISIRYLGEDLIFSVFQSDKQVVYIDGKNLLIGGADINNQTKLFAQFDRWWRKDSLRILNAQVNKLFPIVEKYNIRRPTVLLRKMKTLWGSCSPHRGTITFNQYLTKANPACIEYVVLHELVHFLYPNHSKLFHDFLSNYMPDWKFRKKVLDQDEVHGL
ncbi:M48 family metallopeptidase [Christensenella intestinihominis]|uniref:M48 family metallopeptidase n=1 Tax=Christensenella intestinihominis TaxID=1851429 RepID=UPI00082C22DB|nr:SprT family zinc-dependent metalloprotease [Christensenella intestinihominis]